MWSNTLGDCFTVTTFGESHGPALGAVIDGVLPGIAIDISDIQAELNRRRPGGALASPRKEPDDIEILSGVFEGKTTGAPICLLLRNRDARPEDYEHLKDVFRPGHGDYTWQKKFGIRDWRGGGRLSGRETAARVGAGAVAKILLKSRGISIIGQVLQIGDIMANTDDSAVIEQNPVRCADPRAAARMQQAIEDARAAGDSLGGVVQVRCAGVPAGLGDPVFRKLDAALAHAMMSIGGVKAVEIGSGFDAAVMRGSQHNDPLTPEGFATNNAGGLLGGISSGQDIIVRLGVKPTASIGRPQQSIDTAGNAVNITVGGRHDPCVCPRLVPVAEAMAALALADALLAQEAVTQADDSLDSLRMELDRRDAELLAALGARFGVVRRIGALKGKSGGAIEDKNREAEVRQNWQELARHYGLAESLTDKLLSLILSTSKDEQGK